MNSLLCFSTSRSQCRRRALDLGTALAGLLVLLGCATPPPAEDREAVAIYEETNDPLEPMNRAIFEFNREFDRYLLRPLAEAYSYVPQPVQNGIRNVLNNLRSPVIFANDLMQGEMARAGDTFGRFLTNTFIGLGGVFDVAAGDNPEAGIPFHSEDFGQTLAVWGAPDGPYLMLPFLGPSSPRDATGSVVDSFLDPMGELLVQGNEVAFSAGRFGLRAVDTYSRNIETVDQIERTSIDFYATVRSLYRQNRAAAIANERDDDLGPAPEIMFEEISMEIDDEERQSHASAKPE